MTALGQKQTFAGGWRWPDGGILSTGADGIKVAEAVAKDIASSAVIPA